MSSWKENNNTTCLNRVSYFLYTDNCLSVWINPLFSWLLNLIAIPISTIIYELMANEICTVWHRKRWQAKATPYRVTPRQWSGIATSWMHFACNDIKQNSCEFTFLWSTIFLWVSGSYSIFIFAFVCRLVCSLMHSILKDKVFRCDIVDIQRCVIQVNSLWAWVTAITRVGRTRVGNPIDKVS